MDRPEYIYADLGLRKKVIFLVLVITFGGALCLLLLMPRLEVFITLSKPEIA